MEVREQSQVWVLRGLVVEGGLHEIGSSGLVEGCWALEEGGLLECLVWLSDLVGPWGDQGHCYGDHLGLLGV